MIDKRLSLVLYILSLFFWLLDSPEVCSETTESKPSEKNRSKISSQRSEMSEKERADLQSEFNRLSGELKKLGQQFGTSISLPSMNLFDSGKTDQQSTTETISRVQSIQNRMREIQQSFPTQTRRPLPLSEKQIEERIQVLQSEIQGSSKGIEELTKSNPSSDEVRILQRQMRHKKRTLNWLLGQKQRLELVASSIENKSNLQTDTSGNSDNPEPKVSPKSETDSLNHHLVETLDLRELEFFKIHHISATSVIPIITPFLSTNETPIVVDTNTNSIIVKDLPHVLLDLDRILTYIDQPVNIQKSSQVKLDQAIPVNPTTESTP